MATAKKQFSSIKLQQQKLKQQLQKEIVDSDQRFLSHTHSNLVSQVSLPSGTAGASLSGNSLIKLYYKQNNLSSTGGAQINNAITSQSRQPNFQNYSGNNSNHYIFKTTGQKGRKGVAQGMGESNSSLSRKIATSTTDNFPSSTLQLQMSNASLQNMVMQKSNSRAFLKTTIDNMKKIYGMTGFNPITAGKDQSHHHQSMTKQSNSNARKNNFVFEYDKSMNDLLLQTQQNASNYSNQQKMQRQQSSTLVGAGHPTFNHSNLTDNKTSLSRTQSKPQLDSIGKKGGRIHQVQSMKKLPQQCTNNEYNQLIEDSQKLKKLQREQSVGSLSRQKSQARMQTFSQIQTHNNNNSQPAAVVLQQNQQIINFYNNGSGGEHGGYSQEREISGNFHQSQQSKLGKGQQTASQNILQNSCSLANMQSQTGFNLQNLKNYVPQNFHINSPIKNPVDQCLQEMTEQQQSKKFMRTGPVKVIRRDHEQLEQQSSQQQMTQSKENHGGYEPHQLHTDNSQDEPSEKKIKMTKKEALNKLINIDKLRDLLRKSSQERRQDVAKHVKENKDEMLTRTASLMNFKQKQLQDHFEKADARFTPIQNEENCEIDETNDDIRGLLMTLDKGSSGSQSLNKQPLKNQ